ncbi:MAG: T9SS type A sorting domain-containing protein [Sphingobacteriaceae bacterium]|nr:T9SS type A sorting domain-containing protein [Sphingobacteriaceae bacterium]
MKYYLNLVFSMLILNVFAQEPKTCGMLDAYEKLFKTNPEAKAQFDKIIQQQTTNNLQAKPSAVAYTIPVVFHVLHKNGSENISDAQIQSAITILNRDFRKLNADTTSIVTEFKNLAADCEIEFRLATKDPNGNCTNGITRHYDENTNWDTDQSNYIYTWPANKYLNIYVVRSISGGGAAAFTFLPGSVPGNMDAIVSLHGYVGNIGTSNNFSSRTLTHEVGHWLNLQHTWGSTNNPGVSCGDDGVGDTPLTKGFTNCNLGNAIVCTPGIKENIQNYMEYAFCSRMFTYGQKTRMHNALNSNVGGRDNLWTNANLIATGVVNPTLNCAPIASFLQAGTITCVGYSLGFYDHSYNAPINNWEWSSNLSAPVSTLQNGILTFTGSGLADIKLKVSNGNGSDSSIKQVVTVLANATTSGNINLSEGFENIFPTNNWIVSQPTQGSSFVQTTLSAASGSSSAWINNYFDNPNAPVLIFSPGLNFQNQVSAQLSFKYAYAQQTSGNNDRLRVLISNDCGFNWTPLYSKTGAALSTAGVPVTSPFMAPAWNWKTENIDLLDYSGNPQVHIQFEFTPDINGPGNNFFIDDINLNAIVGLSEIQLANTSLQLFPNPTSSNLYLHNKENILLSSYQIMDVSGRVLAENKIESRENKIEINEIDKLSAGVYFIKIKSAQGALLKKIVKQD